MDLFIDRRDLFLRQTISSLKDYYRKLNKNNHREVIFWQIQAYYAPFDGLSVDVFIYIDGSIF